ncbi:MAG: hypothetical protein H0V66_14795 [Bdellovibrionales bacterium]|nr:hypothetical protein [Bdellovibrionales bacterium]
MTKKKYIALIVLCTIAFLIYQRESSISVNNKNDTGPIMLIKPVAERAYIDLNRKPIARVPASSNYVNTPSPDWEKRLQSKLKHQAGDSLKEITIKKERSLVWMRDQNPLLVESVMITMTNQQDVESSFRALVDSQTGKVLESWDQSIFDPANVREGFRVELDPRYTN